MPFTPLKRRAILTAAAATAVAAAVLPSAAQAASLTTTGSTIQYTAAAGEANGLRIFTDATGGIVLDDVVAISETSAACKSVDASSVRCAVASPTIAALLGDQADNVFTENAVPLSVNAGTGDDSYLGGFAKGVSAVSFFGSSGRDVADYRHATAAVTVTKNGGASDGRPGDRDNISSDVENLTGSNFDDTLEGATTASFERYDGLLGNDTMRGNGGPDSFLAGTAADGADTVFGGPDGDTMSYQDRAIGVTVTANLFDKDDGQAGEADTVREIETVIGTRAADHLAASGASQLAVTLLGGDGNDRLSGSAAADLLIGQAGADTMSGREGNDTLGAIDGERDTLFCGDGIDTANRDLVETTVSLCEAGTAQ